MKNKIVLAALLAGICVLTGCSFEKAVPESAAVQNSTASETEKETKETGSEPSFSEEISSASEELTEEEEEGSRILTASDIHYLAKNLTDLQKGFQDTVDHEDGKVMQYIWEITDAFVAEVISGKPDIVILSGDLTYNGEKESHKELAGKLAEVESAGIPVIVIPGNHDINNSQAAQFVGDMSLGADNVTPEEFEEIYKDFGYDEAVSRDSASLSYVYQINDYTRALMLDTCQYEPKNLVGGMIRDDTYDWIEEQMEEAWNLGMNVIPVAHHNLLDESEVYLKDCTIEHSEQLIDQLESWDVPLFLSGHLHVQHYMRSNDDFGIYEIVTSSLSTPPCQYGLLDYGNDGSFHYRTKALDMKSWAQKTGNNNKDLLNFDTFGKKFLSKVFYNQAQDEFAGSDTFKDLSEARKEQMAKVYAQLNAAASAGTVAEIRDKVMEKTGYQLWEEEGYPSILAQYLEWITSDGTKDYNVLDLE